MSLIETITNEYHFYEWLQRSSNYKDKYSLEAAKAIQEYYEDMAGDDDVEFNPIEWICTFTEYTTPKDAWLEYHHAGVVPDDMAILQFFTDATTVILLDDGGMLIREF